MKNKIQSRIFFLVFLLLFSFSFRSIILNITTNLIDWRDHAFVTWLTYTNAEKILSFDIANLFSTNMLYPFKNTLLLTENVLSQSIIATPFLLLTKNPVLIFNIVFIITIILNYISSFLFWKKVFYNNLISFIGSLLIIFSPFFHSELGHPHTLSFWPFFLSLLFVFKHKQEKNNKYLLLSGVFIAIQFTSYVYLAVFLIAILSLYYMVQALYSKYILNNLKYFIIILTTGLVLASPIIKGYLTANKSFNIKRPYREYVTYSAHISDYLFSNNLNTVLHSNKLISKWNNFNHHPGMSFPGFILTILPLLYLFKFTKSKSKITIKVNLDKTDAFFLLITLSGLIFSFGPRAHFNGNYAEFILPYQLILKTIPFINVVRTPIRWAFIFYFGLIYFSLKFMSRLKGKYKSLILVLILVFTLIEYLPLGVKSSADNYIRERDRILKNICNNKPQVVLEIPVTHFDAGTNIVEGLTYITKTILASTYHKCYLVNGYSSYDLESVQKIKDGINHAIFEEDEDVLIKIAQKARADIISISPEKTFKENRDAILITTDKLKQSKQVTPLGDNLFLINK